MRHLISVAWTSFAILGVALAQPAHATTFDLPLDGSISIIDNAGSTGPVAIEVQAVESFALPVFNQQSPQTTVGVYQWISSFSVFDQSGAQVSQSAWFGWNRIDGLWPKLLGHSVLSPALGSEQRNDIVWHIIHSRQYHIGHFDYYFRPEHCL